MPCRTEVLSLADPVYRPGAGIAHHERAARAISRRSQEGTCLICADLVVFARHTTPRRRMQPSRAMSSALRVAGCEAWAGVATPYASSTEPTVKNPGGEYQTRRAVMSRDSTRTARGCQSQSARGITKMRTRNSTGTRTSTALRSTHNTARVFCIAGSSSVPPRRVTPMWCIAPTGGEPNTQAERDSPSV